MIPSTSARIVAAVAGTLLLSGAAVRAPDPGPTVTLELLGRVDGDEDGQATPSDRSAPDQRMSVANTRGETVCAGRTGSDAMLTCRLSPGRYTVTAWPPTGSYLTAAPSADAPVQRTTQVTGPVGTSHQEVFGSSCLRDVAVRVSPVESDYHRMTAVYGVSGGRRESRGEVVLADMGLAWTGERQNVAAAGEVVDLHYDLVVEPGARVQTSPPLELRVEPGGACTFSAEFGFGHQSLTGSVLEDADSDGVPSLADHPVDGATVDVRRVTGGADEFVGRATSDAVGDVTFDMLEPGRYVGHVHPPTGWTVAAGSPGTIEVELFLDQRPEGELVFLLQEDDA